MPTTRAHRFCDTQPPMMPGNASAALIPNFPSSDAKVLSFDLTHSFRPSSSLGGGSPPDAAAAPNRLVIMLQQVP